MYIVGVFFNSQKLLKPKLRKINKLRKFFEGGFKKAQFVYQQ